MKQPTAKDILQRLLQNLMKEGNEPEISQIGDVFTVRLLKEDTGRVIGKNGGSILSIKAIMWHLGIKAVGMPFAVNLLEPTDAKGASPHGLPPMHKIAVNAGKVTEECTEILEVLSIKPFVIHCELNRASNKWEFTINVKPKWNEAMTEPDIESAIILYLQAVGRFLGGIFEVSFIEAK